MHALAVQNFELPKNVLDNRIFFIESYDISYPEIWPMIKKASLSCPRATQIACQMEI